LFRVSLLTDRDLASGFRLAGVEVYSAQNRAEVEAAFRMMLENPQIGLIGVQEDYLPWIEEAFEHRLKGMDLPVVIPFPRPCAVKGADHIAEMVKEAIGYYVKLR